MFFTYHTICRIKKYVCADGIELEYLVLSCTPVNEWSAKQATQICCAGTSWSMCLKYIYFCCQGLLLKQWLQSSTFITINLEFVIVEVCSFLPCWAVTGLVQKYWIPYTAKIFSPFSNVTTSWEIRTNIFECFLHLPFLVVLKFLKMNVIYFKITSRYWRITALLRVA